MPEPDAPVDLAQADPEIPDVEAATPHGFVLNVLLKNDKLERGAGAR